MSQPLPTTWFDDEPDYDPPPPDSYCGVCGTTNGHTQGCPETPEPEEDEDEPAAED